MQADFSMGHTSEKNSSSDSFNNVDEEISVKASKALPEEAQNNLFISEEFSEIPKHLEKYPNISNSRLKSQINEIKQAQDYLSPSELEEFLNLEKYINSTEEMEILGKDQETNLYLDIEHLENLRKQQAIVVRLLSQINLLQWEVEQGYTKIKENEKAKCQEKSLSPVQCRLDSLSLSKNITCSCEIT